MAPASGLQDLRFLRSLGGQYNYQLDREIPMKARHILDGEFQRDTEGAVVQTFIRADARATTTARTLSALGLDDTTAVRDLQRRELLRETGEGSGRFYLDLNHYYKRARSRAELTILVLCALVLLGIVALGRP
jgi:hypothetical protein